MNHESYEPPKYGSMCQNDEGGVCWPNTALTAPADIPDARVSLLHRVQHLAGVGADSGGVLLEAFVFDHGEHLGVLRFSLHSIAQARYTRLCERFGGCLSDRNGYCLSVPRGRRRLRQGCLRTC